MGVMKEQMISVTARIFEELTFLFIMPEVEFPQKQAKFQGMARVIFRGAQPGCLLIKLYGNLLPTIALNMLGADELPSVQGQADAFGELANIICGNILPFLGDPAAIYNLDRPEIFTGTLAGPETDRRLLEKVELGLEDGRVELELYLNHTPA
jgi:CheY-specific phosphatase CheX